MILIAITEQLLPRFLPEDLLTQLRELGPVAISPTPEDHLSPAARPLLAEADVIITGWGTGPVGAEVLAAAPRLRGVIHTGGSVRAHVTKDCYGRGVVVSSQGWANALPVAEYSLAMILLACKGVFRAQRDYRTSRVPYDVQAQLAADGAYETQVGIIGASTIGRRVIGLLAPFELRIALADPTVSAAHAEKLGVKLMGLDELMATSAAVSLHAPWLPSTENMIGGAQLALLRDGATFINTARGAIVDQTALIAELKTGRIDAVLDVTWPEVPEPTSPLWDLPNLTLTPHVAGAAGTELRRLGGSAVRETARVLRGESLHHGVELADFDTIA
jgi:phosphoglycerate dehydrogenase-like enzyme